MPCPYCNCSSCLKCSETEVVCSKCGKSASLAVWGTLPKRVAESYPEGTHGAKKREQKRLKTSGATHQSEHTVGYEVFGDSLDRGGSPFAKVIENRAPAYQEEFASHRAHIGTGSWKDYRGTGVSSDQYRRDQRRMVGNKQVGNAVQFNQLNYAYQPEFRDPSAASNLQKADNSFEQMVKSFQPVPFKFGDTWSQVPVTGIEKAEMLLSRKEARTGSRTTRKEELEAMKKLGIMPGELEQPKKGVAFSFALDRHGIPMDGNCLFHSVWHALQTNVPNAGFFTNDDLRRQAVGYLRHDPDVQELGVADASYLSVMSETGTWGGELEAMALAHVWGVSITVHGPAYTITYNSSATSAFPIHLYYNGTHYSVGQLT
jgi:OTU-like cysteine protease/Agrobacterium VirD5 protein